MRKEITSERLPIKMWLDTLEDAAFEQTKHLANFPFAFHHVALMPDAHSGYGMPIGGVLATEGCVIPNAVGVDIGCGMCAVKTPWTVEELTTEKLKQIMGVIREKIPVGFSHRGLAVDSLLMPMSLVNSKEDGLEVISREYESALHQLGTLGGGNHFIETQKDKDGNVWVMIHSGSRNLGKKVADHYNSMAKASNKFNNDGVPTSWDLAFLATGTAPADKYLREMRFCVLFAQANRALIMHDVAEAFNDVIKWKAIDLTKVINIAHNYAVMENHFGKKVWIHRKGATSALKGEIGIIPGSQGSKSYIVEGLGNPESYNSCSHGAGRQMGRGAAKKNLSLEVEIKRMEDMGVIHSIRSVADLDEAAGAYKDIDVVMKNQEDLVRIVTELTPLGVIKG